MLALNGREPGTDADPFLYVLAEKLHKTVAELEAGMTHLEYVRWQAFLEARAACDSV